MLRKKLFLNLLIILVCGTVALSLPVIASHIQTPTNASTNESTSDWQLVSVFVGNQFENQVDSTVVWQIERRRGKTVLATWDEIYAESNFENTIQYDDKHLKLTAYGLVYDGLQSPDDYQSLYESGYRSTVIYQEHSCILQLD